MVDNKVQNNKYLHNNHSGNNLFNKNNFNKNQLNQNIKNFLLKSLLKRNYIDYNVKLKILTPVHIGSGDELDTFSFIYDNEDNAIKKINLKNFFKHLNEQSIKKYNEIINNKDINVTDLKKFIKSNVIQEDIEYSLKVSDCEDVKKKFNPEKIVENPDNNMKINNFKRDPVTGRILVPGSSVKGAIRTAILNFFLKGNIKKSNKNSGEDIYYIKKYIKKYNKEKITGFKINNIIKDYYNNLKINIDFINSNYPDILMQMIRIRDLLFDKDSTYISSIILYKMDKNKEVYNDTINMNMIYEVLNENVFADGTIQIMNNPLIDMKFLADSCNEFYKNEVIEWMKNLYSKSNCSSEIKYYFNDLYKEISKELSNNQNSGKKGKFLLRLGRFSGYESIAISESMDKKIERGKKLLKYNNMQYIGTIETFVDFYKPAGFVLVEYTGE